MMMHMKLLRQPEFGGHPSAQPLLVVRWWRYCRRGFYPLIDWDIPKASDEEGCER